MPWRDQEFLEPGERWRPVIADTIAHCDRMVLLWCRHSSKSKEVLSECRLAIELEKEIAPVTLDGTEFTKGIGAEIEIGAFQATDLSLFVWWHHELMSWARIPWLLGLICILAAVMLWGRGG